MKKLTTRDLTRMALMTAITCVLSIITLPLGPVPLTLSVLAVFLVGALLPPLQAMITLWAYVLLGLAGLPVYAGMASGLGVVLGPTGGYLLSYPFMALVFSLMCRRRVLWQSILGIPLAIVLCHGVGSLWYSAVTHVPLAQTFAACSLPFLLPDLLKGAAALLLSRAVPRSLLS